MSRRHRNKPKQDPTPEEDRVEVAAFLLGGNIPTQVKAELQRRYRCSPSTADNLVRQARAYIRGAADVDKAEAIAETLGQLEGIIKNPTAKHSERVAAIRTKMSLLGLAAPIKFESVPPLFDPERERLTLKASADELLASLDGRQADVPGFRLPAAHTAPRNGVHAPDDRPDVQPPGG